MTLAKTLLAAAVAGLGALAVYANDNAAAPTGAAQFTGQYPGVGLGGLLQPLEH